MRLPRVLKTTEASTMSLPAPDSELEAPEREREVPVMDQDDVISENSDHEDGDEDGSEFDDSKAQKIFDDWMVFLSLNQRRMLAVILMESLKTRQGMTVKDAATETGSIVGFNEKTARTKAICPNLEGESK